MANELREALNGIQQFSKICRGVIKLEELLGRIASIENAERDAGTRHANLLAQEEAAKAKAKAADDILSGLQMQIVESERLSKEAARQASAAGSEIIGKAQAEADAVKAKSDAQLVEVCAQVQAAGQKIAAIGVEIKAKEEKLFQVNKELAGLKEKALASFK
jgi:hypothetical protein